MGCIWSKLIWKYIKCFGNTLGELLSPRLVVPERGRLEMGKWNSPNLSNTQKIGRLGHSKLVLLQPLEPILNWNFTNLWHPGGVEAPISWHSDTPVASPVASQGDTDGDADAEADGRINEGFRIKKFELPLNQWTSPQFWWFCSWFAAELTMIQIWMESHISGTWFGNSF